MAIRKIKANAARVEGDYVLVEQHSQKTLGAFLGFVVGIGLAVLINEDWLLNGAVILMATSIGSALFPGEVIREVPQADLVELKHYPEEDRVTVVLDDERVKRKTAR